MGELTLIVGDIGALAVDAQIHPWGRNRLPWLLRPLSETSTSIRRHAGWRPLWDLWRRGPLTPGEACVTDGGRGPALYLVYVCLIETTHSALWKATDSAIRLAHDLGCRTVALPPLSAGRGPFSPETRLEPMLEILRAAQPAFEQIQVAVPSVEMAERLRPLFP
ncbi:macro domain-containing protein [Candidatus Sumerlaeota bacterium]|nr:macro domain-containing protein [Candidatus Sumerlaeota bacterium]